MAGQLADRAKDRYTQVTDPHYALALQAFRANTEAPFRIRVTLRFRVPLPCKQLEPRRWGKNPVGKPAINWQDFRQCQRRTGRDRKGQICRNLLQDLLLVTLVHKQSQPVLIRYVGRAGVEPAT